MAEVITFGNRKGGVAKTTTAAATSFLLSLMGAKVFATELDGQGHLGEMLTSHPSESFSGRTIFDAIKYGDVSPYIMPLSENLDILPADVSLAMLQDWLFTPGNLPSDVRPQEALKRALAPVKDKYDYIIIDTAPEFSEGMINALAASSFVIGCTDGSKPAMTGLRGFLNIVKTVQEEVNPELKLMGVLVGMLEGVRKDHQKMKLKLQLDYGDLLFKTMIKKTAATGRLYLLGYDENTNPELQVALEQFIPFVKEMITRGKEKS